MSTTTSIFRVGKDTSKSLQRLSTGLRINSAADDAAGLGVSENLRTQVRGMQQALRNTQDSISLLQIADGALTEQANILQRMRELVIQAKNDTYTQTERDYMYQEFSGLMGELDRIAAVTNYNGMSIFAAPEAQSGSEGQTMYSSSNPSFTPHTLRDARSAWDDPEDSIFGAQDNGSANHFNMMIGANYEAEDVAAYNAIYHSFQSSASNMLMIQFGQMDSNALLTKDPALSMGNASRLYDSFHFTPATDIQDRVLDWAHDGVFMNDDGKVGIKLEYLLKMIDGVDEVSDPAFNDVGRLRGDSMTYGISHNKTGLQRVNEMRGNIGAMINRLEHSTNNLMNQINNTQSAESLIRDVDFAIETATFSRNQILTQSSTAMLAQSNMLPQSVLSLLG
jgi:flagellin